MAQIKIGKFIASCRKEQSMTQTVLAENLGISDRAISKWETGKKKWIVWMSLLSVLVLASLTMNIYQICTDDADKGEKYYTLFVGTNDKDTYKPEISPEESLQITEDICIKYLDGATFDMSVGIWKDEQGKAVPENTIQILIYDSDIDTIHNICDEIIKELNQNCILIVTGRADVQYYQGE